ncbi:hypothetical protein BS78_06G053400 [Paspalum vaginatum]|nr:hypothetical protein BS78_06G053400 [Paspalum vaginatum]
MSESSPSSAKPGMVDFERSSFEEWAQAAESEDSDCVYMIHVLCFVHYFLPLVLDLIISPLLLLCQDLLVRAWGWERLRPRIHGSIDWDQYKTYLEDVFNMEESRMCSQIKEHAMVVLKSEGEYPAAAAALLSIKTEAELMVVLLSHGYDTRVVTLGNKIHRSALNLMLYKGSEYAAASGAMMDLFVTRVLQKRLLSFLTQHDKISLGAYMEYYDILRMRESIAVDLAKLEQELSYETTGYDGTLASGKTGNKSLNNQTKTEEVEDGNVGASKPQAADDVPS